MIEFSDDHTRIGEVANTQKGNMLPSNLCDIAKQTASITLHPLCPQHYLRKQNTITSEKTIWDQDWKVGRWPRDNLCVVYCVEQPEKHCLVFTCQSDHPLNTHGRDWGSPSSQNFVLHLISANQSAVHAIELNGPNSPMTWINGITPVINLSQCGFKDSNFSARALRTRQDRKRAGPVAAFYTAMWDPYSW